MLLIKWILFVAAVTHSFHSCFSSKWQLLELRVLSSQCLTTPATITMLVVRILIKMRVRTIVIKSSYGAVLLSLKLPSAYFHISHIFTCFSYYQYNLRNTYTQQAYHNAIELHHNLYTVTQQ
jgi:hypothetical protein